MRPATTATPFTWRAPATRSSAFERGQLALQLLRAGVSSARCSSSSLRSRCGASAGAILRMSPISRSTRSLAGHRLDAPPCPPPPRCAARPTATAPSVVHLEEADLAGRRRGGCRRTARSRSRRCAPRARGRRTSRRTAPSRPRPSASSRSISSWVTGRVGLHLLVDQLLDLLDLAVLHRAAVREVEAQVIGRHQRAGLRHVRAEHPAQRRVQQVRAGVVLAQARAGAATRRSPPRPRSRGSRPPAPSRGARSAWRRGSRCRRSRRGPARPTSEPVSPIWPPDSA